MGVRPVITAVERAEEDVRAGNLGLARQRLESYVSTKGYDPHLLARLGHICWEMKDQFNAGRHWLLSDAVGAEVDEALAFFMKTGNDNPRQIASFVLRSVRLSRLDQYPSAVQERLKGLKLADELIRRPGPSGPVRRRRSLESIFLYGIFFLIVIVSLSSCVVGFKTIVGWALE